MRVRTVAVLVCAMLLIVTGCSGGAQPEAVPAGSASAGTETESGSLPEPAAAPATGPSTAPAAAQPEKKAEVRLYRAFRLEQGLARWGFVDETGTYVVEPQFEVAEEFGPDGLAVVYRNGKAGLINQEGRVVLEPSANFIMAPSDGVRVVYFENSRRAVDARGATLFESASLVGKFGSGLAPAERAGKYGYVDKSGAMVIEPQFLYAEPFVDGKAVVKIAEQHFAVIDSTGKRLLELNHQSVSHLAEGMVGFLDASTHKWGYASLTGDVAVAPQFEQARTFAGGLAVVAAEPLRGYGVIDRQGSFVIPPQYSDIQDLGDGLFAVGEPQEHYVPAPFVRHALFTAEGKQVTEFLYYEVEPTEQFLSVTDETATFVLDREGRRVRTLPAADGVGTIRFIGKLIEINADGSLSYLTRDGNLVWQADESWPLAGGVRVISHKYRPDRYVSVRFPELAGLADEKLQAAINERLKGRFVSERKGATDADKNASFSSGFTVQQVGKVLVMKHTGNLYFMGAAHGMPSQAYYHIDLTTGAEYRLADLFKPGSPYPQRLREAVSRQIAADPDRARVNDTNPSVRSDHGFAAGPDGLQLYWDVYAIGPYAAGFPTFQIPYSAVMDLIDTEGAFWKALH